MTTYEFHTAIDEVLAKSLANLPPDQQPACYSCTNPHCCSEPAYCDQAEVEHMLKALTTEEQGHVIESTRQWQAIFSASDVTGEEEVSAFKYRLLNLPCPFLKAGRCLTYARRPLACREFFALGNPEDCAMPARIHQKYASYPKPHALDHLLTRYYHHRLKTVGWLEMDHIGAHLVRLLLNQPEFTTGAHRRVNAIS